MATNYNSHINKKKSTIPQSEKVDEGQVLNNAGGYTFTVDKFMALRRFLILGTEGGTYYVGEKELTKANVKSLEACLNEDHAKTIDMITLISHEGLAPKNDPAIFALAVAMCHKDEHVRKYAAAAVEDVCRIGTHILTLASYVDHLRSWGRLIRNTFGNWYTSQPAEKLAYQVTKYANRSGWTHRDILRSIHLKTENLETGLVLNTVAKDFEMIKADKEEHLHSPAAEYLKAVLAIKDPMLTIGSACELITEHKLPREVLPTEALNHKQIWLAMLPHMKMTALMRNLGKMTSIEAINNVNEADIANRFLDEEAIHKSRLHPFNILVSLKTYEAGHGFKGSLSWTPRQRIISALDKAFYLAFKNVEPTGKRICMGVDVSGSMSSSMDNSNVRYCEGSAALAMAIARTEKNYFIGGFSDQFVDLNIIPDMSLAQACKKVLMDNFGGTDAAVAIQYALDHKQQFDAFIIITDNETWAGPKHAHVALQEYRRKMNIPDCKLITIGMAANEFTIADPKDKNMMDIVGFDASALTIISEFIKGNI
jgi:60 kDa SS-A/Ro ribonucleoprotein